MANGAVCRRQSESGDVSYSPPVVLWGRKLRGASRRKEKGKIKF